MKATSAAIEAEIDHFEATLAKAALIEQSLASEDAARLDRASSERLAATPGAREELTPAPSDPVWVAAWLGVSAPSDPNVASTSTSAPEDDWTTEAPAMIIELTGSGEDPPFDAPSFDELCGANMISAPLEIDADEPAPGGTPLEAPGQMASHQLHSVAHNPSRLDYLVRARQAAQAQASPVQHRVAIPQLSPWTIAAGLAAPLLALSALAVLNAVKGDGDTALVGASAAAQPAPSSERDPVIDYRRGLQLLEAGRARDGLALLRSAAEAGLAPAQYRLAKLYEHGEGAPRNLALARDWTERAAQGGNCRAMHDLGVYYAQGEGAPRDEAQAFQWFLHAAGLGVVDSQYNLGLLYQHGRGVEADADNALYWFLVAARQHDLNAIDRAVALAAQMAPDRVERAQTRARSFEPRRADPVANGGLGGDIAAPCATVLERPENS